MVQSRYQLGQMSSEGLTVAEGSASKVVHSHAWLVLVVNRRVQLFTMWATL